MKTLITGAKGQLGGALVKTAPQGALLTAIDLEELDLSDLAAVRTFLGENRPDVILNAAAYTAVDKAESDEALARTINAEVVAVLSQTMAKRGGKLVHVSTDFVFDGSSARAYLPDDQRSPLSVYGHTKAAGEDALHTNDLLVRTAWVYETGGANFVRTMLRLMREREELGIVADQIGAPTWARGLAQTIWDLVAADASGIFHHCDAGTASWYDFAVAIAEEAHAIGLLDAIPAIRPITTADYPTPAARPAFSLLDCRATREALGSEPVHWRANLRLMLAEEAVRG